MYFPSFDQFIASRQYVEDLRLVPIIGDNFEHSKQPVNGYIYDDTYYIVKTGDEYHTVLSIEEPCSKYLAEIEEILYNYFSRN